MKISIYIITCAIIFIIPIAGTDIKSQHELSSYQFVKTFNGNVLIPVEISKAEREFYQQFPGATGSYTLKEQSGQSVFFRYTEKPTRMLHSAEGCYRASGYKTEFTDNIKVSVTELSSEPLPWSQFRIKEGETPFLIRQCIVSLSADITYSDVPSWYWQTMFSSDDKGPWLAITWRIPEDTL